MSGKFRIAAAAMALLIGSSSLAVAQSDTTKIDLSGNWSFTVVYEGGQGSPTVRLVQKADTLTGRYISQAFGELDLSGGVNGKEFWFSVRTSAGGDPFTMTFNGVAESADLLKGSVELGGNGGGTFTAKRQKQEPSELTQKTTQLPELQSRGHGGRGADK
jgi:hypothetical protein